MDSLEQLFMSELSRNDEHDQHSMDRIDRLNNTILAQGSYLIQNDNEIRNEILYFC